MVAPFPYDPEIGNLICDRLASGDKLTAICLEDGMPSKATFFKWRAESEEFANQYARARRDWAETQLEEIIEIADDKTLQADDRRVRIDTRKWAMGKLNGKYSDKLKHVGGDEEDQPIGFTLIERRIIDPSDRDAA